MIELKDVRKSFGKNEVLKGINLQIDKGEVVVIIGPSGSGKSTVLRTMNYLEEPTSGHVIVDGMDLSDKNKLNAVRTEVGMVFQNFNLFPHMTVLDNLILAPVNVRKTDKKEAQDIAMKLLERVGLADKAQMYPDSLSGGQKQRVAIAGVVALRPAILILDEATSMLDPEGRRELIETVKGIRKDYDMTVISITHDLEEVAMSDRVLIMKKGSIESTSSPRELFSRNDLDQIGLDDPFANQLKHSLSQNGYDLPENYLTESELEDKLWELL